jgi:predicted membrane protein
MRDQARMQRRMQMNQWRGQRRGPRPIVPGLVLLIIGALFLLNNLGVFDIREFRMYWPVILIVVGAFTAIFPRHGVRSVVWSGALIVTGGLLLSQNLGYIRGNVWEIIWPVFLIFLGLSFLFRGRAGFAGCAGTPPWGGTASGSTANRLNEETVFGGVKQRVDSQEFQGGYLSCVFGGIEIDLRGANTKLDELKIQADAVFGGIELTLPSHWNTTVRGSGIFGGFEDKTHPPTGAPGEKPPHVIVTGSAVFGGVSVRN